MIKKNMAALKQANIGPALMPAMIKDAGIWWQITRNLKEIEGSWGRAFATYVRLFEGVPRKSPRFPEVPGDKKGMRQ